MRTVGRSNREEAIFVVLFSLGLTDPLRNSDYVRWLADLLGANNSGEAYKLYPSSAYDSLFWNFVAQTTDITYTCPTRRLALAAAATGPTWRYLYTHVMENDPDQAVFRAAHSFEDPFLWHQFYPLTSGDPYVATAAEETLSATMASYWTNFAKTGDPNGAGLPSWPATTARTSRTKYSMTSFTPTPPTMFRSANSWTAFSHFLGGARSSTT